jgi:hypothetical protein
MFTLNHDVDVGSALATGADIKNISGNTEEIPIAKARTLHAINFFSLFMIHLHPIHYSNAVYNSPRRTTPFL